MGQEFAQPDEWRHDRAALAVLDDPRRRACSGWWAT